MEYTVTKWTIAKLYSTYTKGKLNLSPPYQRNFIWSTKDQQSLIDSINKHIPIPNFFLLKRGDNNFEMIDGQQRSRTIIGFINKQFKDSQGNLFSQTKHPFLFQYIIPATIIHDIQGQPIEKFYALVNKTGLHLNKPEVRKADFYSTKLRNLVNELAGSKKFLSLKLFTDTTLKRMNDNEFVSELLVLIKDGHVDKKGHLDDYFEKDISDHEYKSFRQDFLNTIDKILELNSIYPINKTRYKQRNDFFTLFDFVLHYSPYDKAELDYFYRLLVLIGSDIKPTQEHCEALKEYARNCVTQSNSKMARDSRLRFFQDLLMNKTNKPNETQKQLSKFYNLENFALKKLNSYYTLNLQTISEMKQTEILS